MLPDKLAGSVTGEALDGLRVVRVEPVGVGREDDVGRVLDEESVSLLALPQLPFQPVALDHVARRAVDPRERAVARLGDRAHLERDQPAVGVDEAQPRRDLERRVVTELAEAGTLGGWIVIADDRAERLADEILGVVAEAATDGLRYVREAALLVDRIDHVGRVLDEEAVALLGRAQLALQAVAFAHVADRAVGARERAVRVERAEGSELGGDRVAVAVEEIEPTAQLLELRGEVGGPVELRDVPGRLMDERPKVLAE